MNKKILFVSTTRADLNYFYPILFQIANEPHIDTKLLLTCYHFIESDVDSIVNTLSIDCIKMNPFEEIKVVKENSKDLVMSANVLLKLSGINFDPDIVVVLGDRHEILPIAYFSILKGALLAHIGGGEGHISMCTDTEIRNAVTKLAHVHFVSHDLYKQRLLLMGESKERIFNVGYTSLHNLKEIPSLSNYFIDFLKTHSIFYNKKEFVHFCFHPVTNLTDFGESELIALLETINHFSEFIYICTGVNSDMGSHKLIRIIKDYESKNKNFYYFENLGKKVYYSLLSHCKFMIGNSSSGLIETIKFNLPTINFGKRQNGRLYTENVFNATTKEQSIKYINKIKSNDHNFFENSLYKESGINQIIDILKTIDIERYKIKTLPETLNNKIQLCNN